MAKQERPARRPVRRGDYKDQAAEGLVDVFDLDSESKWVLLLTLMEHFGMLHNLDEKFPEPSPLRKKKGV